MSQDTILSALLDYYSDKASAEASAVVATTFGLFVVLTALGNRPLIFLTYWILWSAGLYFLLGFGYWAAHATRTKNFLVGKTQLESCKKADAQIENLVKEHWKETFMRNIYCSLKLRVKLSGSKWLHKSENPWKLRLSDLLHILFFIFGVGLSYVFFPNVTCSIPGVVVWGTFSCVFALEIVSIAKHRCWSKKEKESQE